MSAEPLTSPSFAYHGPSYFDIPPPNIIPQRSPTVARPLSMTFSELGISDHSSTSDDDQDSPSKRRSYSSRYSSHLDPEVTDFGLAARRRPQVNRSSTCTLPSLSHTPSSSVGTAASISSYRPLPPRHDPLGGHYHTKSADLVIPAYPGTSPADASVKSSASTMTSFKVAEAGDVAFDRTEWKPRSGGAASGSLRQLFGHDGMVQASKAASCTR